MHDEQRHGYDQEFAHSSRIFAHRTRRGKTQLPFRLIQRLG
jgi:hypothetical protein